MINFKDKNFWKMTLALALPIAMQNLLTSSFTLVDTVMIGQLGDVSLSAVGMAGQVSWLLNIVLFGFCSGGAVFISQYWGAKDISGIKRTIGIATIASFLMAVMFMLFSLIIPERIVHIFNQEPIIIAEGSAYLRVVAWSYPAIALNLALCSCLRAVERVRIPVVVSLVTTVVNIFLDYCLIFGKFGFPEMGIVGGALATVIAAWTAPVVIVIGSVISKNILFDKPKAFLGFDVGFLKFYLKKSIPVVFNEALWGMAMVTFNIIYANLGYEEYAAVTISRSLENMVFVFFAGVGTASSILVGKSIGSGDIKQAKLDAKRYTLLTPVLGIVLGTLVFLFREQLIGLFNMSDNISEVTYNTALDVLLVYSCAISIRNIPYIQVCGIFRPGGDTTMGAKVDIICSWCISLPATLIAAYVLKLPFPLVMAVMYAFDDIPNSTLCLKYFLSDKWIRPVTEQGRRALEKV